MFFGFLDYFQAYSVDMMLQFYRMNLRGWQTIYNFITKLLIIWKQFCIYRRLTCSAEDGFSLRSCWYSQERGRSKLSARYRQTYSSEGNSREQVSVTTAARARARARRRRRRSSQVAHHMRRQRPGSRGLFLSSVTGAFSSVADEPHAVCAVDQPQRWLRPFRRTLEPQ